jgi:lipid A ethanolaminephosphotransferase
MLNRYAPVSSDPVPGRSWNPLVLALWISGWLATAGNVPLWRALWALPEHGGLRGALFSAGLACLIGAATMVLLSLTAWRNVLKPVACALLVVSAASTYFMLQYSVVIDTTMLANVVHTDAREARDLLSWSLLLSLVLVAGVPMVWLLRQKLAVGSWWSQAWRNGLAAVGAFVALVLVTLACYQDLASLMRNHKEARYLINPLNTVYAMGDLAVAQAPGAQQGLQAIGEDARLGASYAGQKKPPLVVLVVGETARAANFSLGGYARNTNPELGALQKTGDLTYYSAVHSCGTNTQASVPCMFSHMGKSGYEASPGRFENLLDVLQRAGLAVLWLDNQSGCKGLCERIPNALTRTLAVPGVCGGDECFDEVMLQGLDQRIAALDPVRRARGVVVVMHQMGSHGPAYYRRTPAAFKTFMPECASNVLQDCPREQLVNAFDNTLVYTDHVLASTVRWLDEKSRDNQADTALVYVSDHGESLGENNLYLHGLPYALAPDFQTHVPMVSWLSGAMQTRTGIRTDCLKQHANAPLTHDNLFHAMLGLLDVQTQIYKPALDWFSPCR